ncbi:DUF6708 domain-containing protein [Pseudomonas sp. GM17]|uniref:DUF6708 domain-containing protein n=1 Tax=Pseudomonas sp. GM17 TaxID=1144323 RepID=UPI00027272A2|nr:DUF6708 domain-containing protein [Pseudomonas sp. GM17]WIE47336.1 hypothetical protein PMI20_016235 [Pseudomonas sp. GM17]
MTISWTWTPKDKAEAVPSIGDQYISMGKSVLCLRNPMPVDSAFMAKLFSATIVVTLLLWLWMFCAVINDTPADEVWVLLIPLLLPLGISLFLFYRIHLIRSQSNFYFNRHTQKVYYLKGKTLLVGDWNNVKAGICGRTEFSGRSFSTTTSLILNAFGTDQDSPQARQIAESWAPTYSICVDSNEPSDPRPIFVAQVWEYIRQFMAHGPDKLPVPQEPHWWYVPHNSICLTPRQAFRHYVPWRTGEPGEKQGKKWWLMPLWLVFFPYNFFVALCWWMTCRLLRVRPAAPPQQALEGESVTSAHLEMTAKTIGP